jgi:hypothetical protein
VGLLKMTNIEKTNGTIEDFSVFNIDQIPEEKRKNERTAETKFFTFTTLFGHS